MVASHRLRSLSNGVAFSDRLWITRAFAGIFELSLRARCGIGREQPNTTGLKRIRSPPLDV